MKTRITVVLDIEGDANDASHVVDSLLDAGFFQDAINEHDVDDCGELHVTSAIVTTTEELAEGEAGATDG